MKKNILNIAALVLCLGFTSCSDDELPYSEAQVTNTELRTILEKQGIQFDETGHMLLDDKVQNLTKLDLTGTKFTDFKALTILPSLNELDLSDNEFGPAFDFSTLPAQITGIDLTGNEIYDYNNLIKVEIAENGDETITNLRDLKKLYLPDEAEENTTDLVRYYRQNKDAIVNGTIDMQMADESGKLAKYTTLRSIPDPVFAAYLKTQFSSVFEGDQIDLGKRLTKEEKLNDILINPYLGIENFDKLENFEGIQYITTNPYWEGKKLMFVFPQAKTLPVLNVPASVELLQMTNVKTKGFDLRNAEGLAYVMLRDVTGLETIDLTGSKVWGQRTIEDESKLMYKTTLQVVGCKNLKTILFPEAKTLRAMQIDIECADALETCDLSKFSFIRSFAVGNVPASYKLTYPNLTEFPGPNPPFRGKFEFSCSEETYKLQATKDFIEKYQSLDGTLRIKHGRLQYNGNKEYYW